jgi:predicted ABC-type ATPase
MSKAKSKRMRVFAGPNGAGKSTIIKEIQKVVKTGPYINADDIEKACIDKGFINLGDYGIEATAHEFENFLKQSTLLKKAEQEQFQISLFFSNNIITVTAPIHSYAAALIAEFLREILVSKGDTFSFETVMSHASKLATLKRAHEMGFKNYLYFISTESVDINVERVNARVLKGGHPVQEQKIRDRYIRSMDLLSSMIPFCHRCFIWDNSGEQYRLILEIVDGETIRVLEDNIPGWIYIYVLQKLGVS